MKEAMEVAIKMITEAPMTIINEVDESLFPRVIRADKMCMHHNIYELRLPYHQITVILSP